MLKRAAFKVQCFLIVFLWYTILFLDIKAIVKHISFITKEYCPLFLWAINVAYFLNPTQTLGAQFFQKNLKKILLSMCVKVTFVMTFATDQLTSFITPLKDMEYTICYYFSKFKSPDQQPECFTYQYFNSSFYLAVFALSLRIIQDFKLMKYDKTHLSKNRGYNIVKYLLAIVTIFVSSLTKNNIVIIILFPFNVQFWYNIWIVLAVLTTIYSYIWDITQDWGFLQKNSPKRFLRRDLLYKTIPYYYVSMIIDFPLRFVWICTLSLDVQFYV